MDLGCLDLCCIDKNSYDPTSGDSERSAVVSPPPTTTSNLNAKTGKTKMLKETGQSTSTNGLNKLKSQMKKPPHRKNSPINWFPRKKVDSYLERKIKMMQEVGGMNLTLDETLDDSNPHYCRVLREKIAAREAAHKAVEARKAALVEASWCRILKAARIQRKEADIELEKAEKAAAEAVEAASALGVIMNDKPSCPQKPSPIETKKGGEFTTLTVTASFVTPFEVDREVAAAVKAAFLHLASSSSFSKDEFKDLVQKISQNPDSNLTEYSSDSESALGSDQEKSPLKPILQRKQKRRLSLEKLTKEKIVDMMVERLKCLHEDELSSLATIVATCGLNAALAEVGSGKIHEHNRRASSSCSSKTETGLLPSLDKFLVKHETKLEREVREAKNTNRNEVKDKAKGNENDTGDENVNLEVPGLEKLLVKHVSKLEREVQEAKSTHKSRNQATGEEEEANANPVTEIPSLDSILVKRVSRLEQEVLEARNKRKHDGLEASNAMKFKKRVSLDKLSEKENVNLNEDEKEQSLDKIMIKPMSRLEKEKMLALSTRTDYDYQKIQKKQIGDNCESLDKILVKPMSRLEKEKMLDLSTRTDYDYQKSQKKQTGDSCECLDKILVKPMSRLEKEKMEALSSGTDYDYPKSQKKQTVDSCESLDKILVKPMSRLEKEKMQALSSGSNNYEYKKKSQMKPNVDDSESLDKVLVKRASRLDKEKMNLSYKEEFLPKVKRSEQDMNLQKGGGLEEILVKHKPRLERERAEEAASQQPVDEIKVSVSRKQAREKELQDCWGGLSLGNSMKPHISKLEKDKAEWIQAEEEERNKDPVGDVNGS